ncbi:hypothetical protein [Mangrovimonas sp. YM274]|uniref:hypothetical protein n=1 Tax=Mangrovimonas sp. YM274 TaxID=3070660 RepID=UPI0027DDAA45|nr:hypothetical protein [Mangrovimonas sp. YM274]WMI68170.1 hypothetical protein RBH95_13575 [Mangrovimonas sp. YM274]
MEMNLDDLQMEIMGNLFVAGVYYFPRLLLEMSEAEAQKDFSMFGNRVLLIEENGSNYFVEPGEIHLKVMHKQRLLDKNLLKLLGLCDDQKRRDVDFLLERYKTYVEGVSMLYNWFAENMEVEVQGISKDQKRAFISQRDTLARHKVEVEQRFFDKPAQIEKKDKTEQDQKEVLNKTIAQLKKMIAPNVDISLPVLELGEQEPPEPKLDERKQHLQNLKDRAKQEAEHVLLTQVFNLKLKPIEALG